MRCQNVRIGSRTHSKVQRFLEAQCSFVKTLAKLTAANVSRYTRCMTFERVRADFQAE